VKVWYEVLQPAQRIIVDSPALLPR
jgi:hypothetical protein